MAPHQLVDQAGVADVALNECEAIFGQPRQGRAIPGICQLVQYRDGGAGVVEHVANEVGSDESCPASHEKFRHASHPMNDGSRTAAVSGRLTLRD